MSFPLPSGPHPAPVEDALVESSLKMPDLSTRNLARARTRPGTSSRMAADTLLSLCRPVLSEFTSTVPLDDTFNISQLTNDLQFPLLPQLKSAYVRVDISISTDSEFFLSEEKRSTVWPAFRPWRTASQTLSNNDSGLIVKVRGLVPVLRPVYTTSRPSGELATLQFPRTKMNWPYL
ncbi:hypothetical protein T310_9398 [Rasamsonia emersonii CBS 393.64]|uniref:Uncharacterized protein n=1 Tax=Rasamsonia emersonii (strain ATCC 16479 / CBS 393.64 / IMI 116815) TaxID=1408163 RepID=A0A0F4YFG3_RASE3|nr:hypothetical protein T310_9398 [Rasamsonia emersonii CBS 393.64]KKA16992.1 hypothetical protein T310_9398 [Rasamsonia emersonii CBS 393.64]